MESGDTFRCWKEIAFYLRRDVRTVQRWEKAEGLPVRRHAHPHRASVYAHRAELDEWLERRRLADPVAPEPPQPSGRSWAGWPPARATAIAAAGVTLMLVLGIGLYRVAGAGTAGPPASSQSQPSETSPANPSQANQPSQVPRSPQ